MNRNKRQNGWIIQYRISTVCVYRCMYLAYSLSKLYEGCRIFSLMSESYGERERDVDYERQSKVKRARLKEMER